MNRKRHPEYDYLMKLEGLSLSSPAYRNLLDNISPKCDVEAWETKQAGTVESIIRNRYGAPVCLKVRCGEDNSIDYISVDRVTFWEPYDHYVPDEDYEEINPEDYEPEDSEGDEEWSEEE